ncbi:MAG TPA: pyridoxal-dependent decarboxylase, exosortase A system-associated, partial [Arenibaculum sp.]|nr:pyridoxal-dependent decarboxylase, exosortase A system-associated [Arenibaculum sp.]
MIDRVETLGRREGLEILDGCLAVGGIPLPLLAQRVGTTPFFAYSRAAVTARVTRLRRALPASIHLSYAVKANPMPALVEHLARLVDGLDVASAREMRTALDTPMPPVDISFAGPGKLPDEIARAVAAGVLINLESPAQAVLTARAGERLGRRPRVCVRVNPDFDMRGGGLHMGGGAKAFGVDAEQVPDLLHDIHRLELGFEGFHFFQGSQNLDPAALCAIQERTAELALELAGRAREPVIRLNLGGGFGIPHFPGDRPLPIEAIGERLAEPA